MQLIRSISGFICHMWHTKTNGRLPLNFYFKYVTRIYVKIDYKEANVALIYHALSKLHIPCNHSSGQELLGLHQWRHLPCSLLLSHAQCFPPISASKLVKGLQKVYPCHSLEFQTALKIPTLQFNS